MKHIFILNPAAGRGEADKKLPGEIMRAAKSEGAEYEIHRTTGPGEAEYYIKHKCAAHAPERLRFYACGGDGTVNETLNGIHGFAGAEIAVIPAGSGNDFARVFQNSRDFRDIAGMIRGVSIPIDVISCELTPEDGGLPLRRFAANMCNIGLDSEAAAKASLLNKNTFLGGTSSYVAGVGAALIQNKTTDLTLRFDDGEVVSRRVTLAGAANGAYCGGGFMSAPLASPRDGLLDVYIVGEVTRRLFLSLLRKYHDGTHLQDPRTETLITYKHCKWVDILPQNVMTLSIDGEVLRVRRAVFKILENAVMLSLPRPDGTNENNQRRKIRWMNE